MKSAAVALLVSTQVLAGGGGLGGGLPSVPVASTPYIVPAGAYATSSYDLPISGAYTVPSGAYAYAAPNTFTSTTSQYVSQQPQFQRPQFQQPQFQQPQFYTSQQTQLYGSQQPQFYGSGPRVLQDPSQFLQSGPQFNVALASVPTVFQGTDVGVVGAGGIGAGGPALPGGPLGGGKHGGKHGATVVAQPQQFVTQQVEERVFKNPISQSVQTLPANVNRVQKTVVNHYPYITQTVQPHLTIQDEQVQNVIHHYYQPTDQFLGVQQGQNFVSEIQVDHPGEMYVDDNVQPMVQQMDVGLGEDVLSYGEEAIRPFTSQSSSVSLPASYISSSAYNLDPYSSDYVATTTKSIPGTSTGSQYISSSSGATYNPYANKKGTSAGSTTTMSSGISYNPYGSSNTVYSDAKYSDMGVPAASDGTKGNQGASYNPYASSNLKQKRRR